MDQYDDEWQAQVRAASRLMGGSMIADMLKPNGELRTYDEVVAEELALIRAERAKEEAKRTRLEHLARIDHARAQGIEEANSIYRAGNSSEGLARTWGVAAPAKGDALALMLYKVLRSLQTQPTPPNVAEVIAALEEAKPGDFIAARDGGIEWYDSKGSIQHTSIINLRDRIKRMTGQKAKR